MALTFRICSQSHIGFVKTRNEDRFLSEKNGPVLAVADGMGGELGGDVASTEAIRAIAEYAPPSGGPSARELADLVRQTSETIRLKGESDPDLIYMGTTLTAVFFFNTKENPGGCIRGTFVHVGDSRIYRLRRGELRLLTHDHRFFQELIDAGDMTLEETRQSPMFNHLDQAVGAPDIEPETGFIVPRKGDLYLLCSDGLTDMIDENQVHDILTRPVSVESMAEALIQAALAAGGMDNVTVVLALADIA